MGIKNNVAYTDGTVEQLGESVFYGSSTVNASLWTNYPDYTYAGIITTLNSNVDFSSGDYTLFFYAKPSGQTVGSFSQLARACCQAYNVVYAEYNDDPSDMRTKIYWSKMGLSPTTSLLLQYFILKTGNTGEGSCRIVNAMPFDFDGYNTKNFSGNTLTFGASYFGENIKCKHYLINSMNVRENKIAVAKISGVSLDDFILNVSFSVLDINDNHYYQLPYTEVSGGSIVCMIQPYIQLSSDATGWSLQFNNYFADSIAENRFKQCSGHMFIYYAKKGI